MRNNRILLTALGLVASVWGASAASLPSSMAIYSETAPTENPADGSESITLKYNITFTGPAANWNFDFDQNSIDQHGYDHATVTIGLSGATADDEVNVNLYYSGDLTTPLKTYSGYLTLGQTSLSFDPPFTSSDFTVNYSLVKGPPLTIQTVEVKLTAPDIGSSGTLLGLGLAGLAGFRRSRFCAKA